MPKIENGVLVQGAPTDIDSAGNMIIPNNIISVEANAYDGFTNLKSITFTARVTSIGIGAFSNCTSLISVSLPKELAIIDSFTFDSNTSLIAIDIPNSVTSINMYAFSNCIKLASLTLPHGVINIGVSAFSGCKSLTTITIPASVATISSSAFNGCDSLQAIIIDALPGSNDFERIKLLLPFNLSDKAIPKTIYLEVTAIKEQALETIVKDSESLIATPALSFFKIPEELIREIHLNTGRTDSHSVKKLSEKIDSFALPHNSEALVRFQRKVEQHTEQILNYCKVRNKHTIISKREQASLSGTDKYGTHKRESDDVQEVEAFISRKKRKTMSF